MQSFQIIIEFIYFQVMHTFFHLILLFIISSSCNVTARLWNGDCFSSEQYVVL